MVIWLIGLSSSGKTTIAKEIIKLLKKQNKSSILVDGDEGRKVWGDDLGHDILSREINAGRLSRLCQVLDQQNVEVVGAVLSLFPKWQNWNRKNFSQYYEVYLDVPMHILEKRDPKLIYKRARQGELKNVAGIDLAFKVPPNPDLVIKEPKVLKKPQIIAKYILEKINEK